MKKTVILFFILFCSCSLSAQIQWQQSLGGTFNEYARSVIQTYDNGYVVAGASESNDGDVTGNHGNEDYWVVKINASGIIQWQQSLGGTGNDYAYSIIQTYDSGFVVVGSSESNDGDVTGNHGNKDYWVVKLNAAGIIQWEQSFGGTGWDEARAIIQTSDSGYAVAGTSLSNDGDVTGNHGNEDYWVVKLNATGIIQWQQSLGGTSNDVASSIIETSDNGYVVAGWSQSNNGDVTSNHGGYDYWVVKLNASGFIQSEQSLGGTNNDYGSSIIETSDSGFVVAGGSLSNDVDVTGNHGSSDYWVAKLNAAGVIQWEQSLGGTAYEAAWSITATSDNGSVIAGYSNSTNGDVTGNHGDLDFWVIKINAAGIIQWQQSLGGTGFEEAYSIIQTSDSGFLVAGRSDSNNGDVTGNHGGADFWLVKLGVATGIENLFNTDALHVYPNPTTNNFTISANSAFDNAQLKIFNAMRCNVYSCRLNRQSKVIDAENFSSGIYYLHILKGEKMWAKKIIKQ